MYKLYTHIKSPNYDLRLPSAAIEFLIMHYTGCDLDTSIKILTDPHTSYRVSAHYLIDEAGKVYHLVDESYRAWHAGKSSWRGLDDINSRSIGIEIVNPGHGPNYRPFPIVQMESVLQISKEITARYQIPLSQVLGHSDIAPGRKVDPGHLFNWKWLAEHGIGLYPVAPLKRGKKVIDGIGDSYETKETEILQIQSLLAFYGYEVPLTGILDEATQAVIKAFQMHFWPTSIYKKDIGPGLIKRLNTLLSYCEPLNKIRSI